MESRTEVTSLNAGGSTGTPARADGRGQDIRRVGEIMSQNVVTATPDDTIFSVAQKMSEQNVSCVVVTYRRRGFLNSGGDGFLRSVSFGGS